MAKKKIKRTRAETLANALKVADVFGWSFGDGWQHIETNELQIAYTRIRGNVAGGKYDANILVLNFDSKEPSGKNVRVLTERREPVWRKPGEYKEEHEYHPHRGIRAQEELDILYNMAMNGVRTKDPERLEIVVDTYRIIRLREHGMDSDRKRKERNSEFPEYDPSDYEDGKRDSGFVRHNSPDWIK